MLVSPMLTLTRRLIGADVKAIRKASGLTQAAFAAELCIAPSSITRWETTALNDRLNPSMSKFILLNFSPWIIRKSGVRGLSWVPRGD